MDSLVALNIAQYLPLHAHNLFLCQLGLEEHCIPSYVNIKEDTIEAYLMLMPTDYCRALLFNGWFVEHVVINVLCQSLFTERVITERIIPSILTVKDALEMNRINRILDHCMRRATIKTRHFFYDRLGVYAETDDIHRHAVISSILHRVGRGYNDYMEQTKDARYADYVYHYTTNVGPPSRWIINNHIFATPVGATMDVFQADLSKTIATLEKAISLGYETCALVGNGPVHATIILPYPDNPKPLENTIIPFIKSYYNVDQ